MKKIQLFVSILVILSLSACGSLSQPTDVGTQSNAQAQKPLHPPKPPVPTPPIPTPVTTSNVSVQCSSDGTFSTCEITINGKKQVRTYEGIVSINVNNGVVQILRDGQVIDEIRG